MFERKEKGVALSATLAHFGNPLSSNASMSYIQHSTILPYATKIIFMLYNNKLNKIIGIQKVQVLH